MEVVLCLIIVLVGWWSPVECFGFCACVFLLCWDLLSSGRLIPIRLPQIDLSVSQWGSQACPYSNTHLQLSSPSVSLFSPFSNVIVRRMIVSSDGVSNRGGELGLSNDVEKRQLRHNSQNFQAHYFVEIDLITSKPAISLKLIFHYECFFYEYTSILYIPSSGHHYQYSL